jgi:PTS system nitrogen regulatory IIA component
MKISDCLSPANVMVDFRASQKRELLQELARKAAGNLSLTADQISTELLKREDLGSTGTGGGVAIPHARINGIENPFAMAVRLRNPIDFDAIDSQPVDLVFVLLLPTSAEREQLGVLASIARKLRAPDTLAQLRRANQASEFYLALTG